MDKEDVCTYMYTVEYNILIKNEVLTFATAWVSLEGIMLGEITQAVKGKYCMLSLICGI